MSTARFDTSRPRIVVRVFWACAGVVGCATAAVGVGSGWNAPPRGPRTAVGAPAGARAFDGAIAAEFETARSRNENLTYPELVERLKLARAPDSPPSFDPTQVAHYGSVRQAFALTEAEESLYRRAGLVAFDRGPRQSMASAYLEIYKRDLPVLITTDSILHAMHRSFDALLEELELGQFAPALRQVLEKTHDALGEQARGLTAPQVRQSARDVDVYLTVARSLLAPAAPHRAPAPVKSILGDDDEVAKILAGIASLRADDHVPIYGGLRAIDWSQLKPRGHYSKSPELGRYFQSMMWLGRADLGFSLAPVDPAFGTRDVAREQRDAAALAWLIDRSGQQKTLDGIGRAIDLFVGAGDNVTVAEMADADRRAAVARLDDLAPAAALDKIEAELAAAAGPDRQRIRSQIGSRLPGGGPETPLPEIFQVFGQRFVLDSFVLSKVVFDSILFQGLAQERTMPKGLDVFAALGNDEAVALLEPDLRQYNYGANLLAARAIVEGRPAAAWDTSLYDLWLSALAKLDDVPAGTFFPEVMRSRAWQRKQLDTQLASWAELRHDTILYAKQSYTMGITCEYPTGYVEPYPEFFARIAFFAEEANRRLYDLQLSSSGVAGFFGDFANTVRRLEGLARKELAATSFDADDRAFIRDTIKLTVKPAVGCGGPPQRIYTGWYPKLIYRGEPEAREPTIADVHTDPNSGQVLEVGAGDADFLLVAIDNKGDRAAYVGPVSSYFEFAHDERLTDEVWREWLAGGLAPARPAWTAAFRAPGAASSASLPGKARASGTPSP